MARGVSTGPAGPFRIDKTPDGSHLVLEGVVGASQAHALQAAARELAGSGEPVRVEAAGLQHMDCAGVQVLLALDETLRQQGRSLVLVSVPPGVSATFRNAGLAHLG